ncbi:methyltransferase domain-containing protein [Candidatus Accumulibacter vicinus]|uniref:Trans-aconitate 2-methyltransferase n=1 Tax=Candidatus Accumulibacter vicinus TaxID=2954382 RepID=A0A084Y598_9PROT|nr:methyltransferase domain-containing protein [Candidatus Accumulibacter vicinus]KFB69892.1 MAG: Trans-aconitate 2-methyltransferase [Candidatus Accumulibacter vicinus]
MNWNPEQYLTFADARQRPALDLLARLDFRSASRIVDLGCGAGNVTQLLAERWPGAQIIGVDSDSAMLANAAATAPTIDWRLAEIASGQSDFPPGLIFSNAALPWLECLDPPAVERFLAVYRERLRAATLFPFNRLFFIAQS